MEYKGRVFYIEDDCMKPTYSFLEAIQLILSVDSRNDINRISNILNEERKRYSFTEIQVLSIVHEKRAESLGLKRPISSIPVNTVRGKKLTWKDKLKLLFQ